MGAICFAIAVMGFVLIAAAILGPSLERRYDE